MNGIKCYLSRTEVKKILADEVARRLEPERLLGACMSETTLYNDGRIEVMFWTPEAPLSLPSEPRNEAHAAAEQPAPHAHPSPQAGSPPRLFNVSGGR